MKAIVNAWTSLSLIKRIVIGPVCHWAVRSKRHYRNRAFRHPFCKRLEGCCPLISILPGNQCAQPHQVT